jgi:CBS domain-containing protein
MNATVRDVMTTEVSTVARQADFKQIVSVLRQYRVSACPVVDDAGHVIGMVSDGDLLAKEADPDLPAGLRLRWRLAEYGKAAAATADQLMTCPAVTIGPDASVVDAARLMQNRRVRRLPVIGADGRLVGIVSRADVLSVYERPDADILAEVTRDVMAGQPAPEAAELDVTVSAGVVTVSGLVGRLETALELLAQIRHVEGVVAIRDRLTVATEALSR